MQFKRFDRKDYEELHDFLVALCQENDHHLRWNWARLEWAMDHPCSDMTCLDLIGTWVDNGKVVAAAIYDMYPGEAFVATLKDYSYLFREVLDYAFANLSDDQGLKVAIHDDEAEQIAIALKAGFVLDGATETLMSQDLKEDLPVRLGDGFTIESIDPVANFYEIQWLVFRAFNHPEDKEAFEKEGLGVIPNRPHFNQDLFLVAKDKNGEMCGLITIWYDPCTDYCYLEPLCVLPSYRHKGIARALVNEGLNRAKSFGAKRCLVVTDWDFYEKLGFHSCQHYTFYRKSSCPAFLSVCGVDYKILKLLGKGKGGYSYLGEKDGKTYVVKAIHHEPCDYYSFGDKIEAEENDYSRLARAKIRIPKLLSLDKENERLVKEYIHGPTIFDLVANDQDVSPYLPQVEEMAKLAKQANLNIDFFPTNFVVQDGLLYYIDYECNDYMDQWNFENWGKQYWSKTRAFLAYLEKHK